MIGENSMESQKVNRTKCINGSYVHRFDAFVDEKMNVTEKCKDCGVSYFHNVSKSYEDMTKNEQKEK
jgi:hypothetical protein